MLQFAGTARALDQFGNPLQANRGRIAALEEQGKGLVEIAGRLVGPAMVGVNPAALCPNIGIISLQRNSLGQVGVRLFPAFQLGIPAAACEPQACVVECQHERVIEIGSGLVPFLQLGAGPCLKRL